MTPPLLGGLAPRYGFPRWEFGRYFWPVVPAAPNAAPFRPYERQRGRVTPLYFSLHGTL